MISRIQKVVTKFRADLIAKESTALDALDTAYAHTLSIIEPVLDILYVAMQEKIDAGEAVPVQWLYENRRLRIVQDQIRKNIDHFGALSLAKAGELQHYAVQLGQDAAQMMLGATVPAGIEWSFGVASPKAIANILGATQSGSPLADLFDGFGMEAAQKAGDALVTGVSLGWNPRDIAPSIEDALNISRNRALTIARDQAMRGYREAALETYQANSDVVGKWRWTCSLSTRTCFPKGVLVRSKRGTIPIEEVVIGDEVLTHKGRYKRVYDALQRPYSGQMVTIKSGNNLVAATSNHPFLAEREGKLNWIQASNIRLTDHVICKSNSSPQVVNHDFCAHNIDAVIDCFALPGAVISRLIVRCAKLLTASFANQVQGWRGIISRSRMRLKVLPCVFAIIPTETSVSFALPSLRNSVLLATDLTSQFDFPCGVVPSPCLTAFRIAKRSFLFAIANVNPSRTCTVGADTLDPAPISFNINYFHASIVSQNRVHIHNDITVYNIEVEEDHSYVANGFVVHNCAACIAMDGTLHNLDDPFGSHVNCRCSPVPVTRSWQDILSDAGIDASDIPDTTIDMQSGEDWFKAQNEDDQRKILGPAKYDAYADGKFELADVVKHIDNADWGPSIQEKSFKELLS